MKKIIATIVLSLVMLAGCTKVEPGYVALRVWTLGEKAGNIDTLGVGRYAWASKGSTTSFPFQTELRMDQGQGGRIPRG